MEIQQQNILEQNPSKVILINVYNRYSKKDVYNFIQKYSQNDSQKFQISGIYKEKKQSDTVIEFVNVKERNNFVTIFNSPEIQEKNKKEHHIRIYDNEDFNKVQKLLSLKCTSVNDFLSINQNKNQGQYFGVRKIPTQEQIQNELKIPLSQSLIPYAQFDYPVQVKKKQQTFLKLIQYWKNHSKKLLSTCQKEIPQWLNDQPEINEFIECDTQFQQNYRTNTKFQIGLDLNQQIVVGYPKGNMGMGTGYTCDGTDLKTNMEITNIIGKEFMQFLRNLNEKSKKYQDNDKLYDIYSIFDKYEQKGYWKVIQIMVSPYTKQILIKLVAYNNGCISKEQIEESKNIVLNFFTQNKEFLDIIESQQQYKIVSINLQVTELSWGKISTEEQVDNIYGQKYYQKQLLGKIFNVYPSSFIQGHTQQCEKLYELVCNNVNLDKNTIVLDLCSGIGTIGICIADRCREVIGIEMIQNACEAAEQNIKINNLQNYRVICGKVEEVINETVEKIKQNYPNSKIVAILDPPRPGVQRSVLISIRKCQQINSVIYIACSPPQVIENLMFLTLPESNRRQGTPFIPKKLSGVDLFPQTEHYEAVFVLQREQKQEIQEQEKQ